MSDGGDGLCAVGSRLSGERQELIPTPDSRQPTAQEPNWPLLYGAVLAELAIIIVLLYTFTKAFA